LAIPEACKVTEARQQNLQLDPTKIARMPATEIDDIFSGKTSTKMKSTVVPTGAERKKKTANPGAVQTTTMGSGEGKKRKKKKKDESRAIATSSRKGEEEVEETLRDGNENENQKMELAPSTTKRQKKRPRDEVEEVVDPSITLKKPRLEKDGKSKRSKGDEAAATKGGGTKDLEVFKDSRGASGRASLSSSRRTHQYC
jgi:hypothetical protein